MRVERTKTIVVALSIIVFLLCAAAALWEPWTESSITPSSPPFSTSTQTSVATSTATLVSPPAHTSASSTPEAAPMQNSGHAIGIAAGGGLSKISQDELNRELDQIVAMGGTWVRFDIEWGDVQYSSPDTSTWGGYDAVVKAIAAHHLNGLGIILFTPQWARDPSCTGGAKCPPQDPTTFATFASEVAARYVPYGIHAWEIWNEPNSYDFWATKTDCAAYTSLIKATYPAIKKVDPGATVITGGLAPLKTDNHNISPTDFLSCVYTNGGEPYFDAVGDHPYTYPAAPLSSSEDAWAKMSLTLPSLRSIMVGNGDTDKKIWITEYGSPTNGPDPAWYVSEAAQAKDAQTALALYKTYSWAGPLFWYTIKDGDTSTTSNENFFGLTRADGSEKPAYVTIQNLIREGL